MQTSCPVVTITIPTYNEANFIEKTLETIMAQEYPHDRMEVIITDGQSSDGTVAAINRFVEQRKPCIPIRVLDNPERIVSTGLNRAILAAEGEIIVRVDGHTVLQPDYVSECVRALQRSNADGVGGAMQCIGVGYVAEAIAAATSTPFGIGNTAYRTARYFKERDVETTHMGAYRKDTLLKIGMFNQHFVRHQDYELDFRIRRGGGTILLVPQIQSHYFVRGSINKLRRQYFQYGFWKGRFLRQYPSSLKIRHLVPPLFVLSLLLPALLLLMGIDIAIFGLLFSTALYCMFLLLATLFTVRKSGWRYAPLLPVIFACVHLSWGSGVWMGLLLPETLSPRHWAR